MWGNRGPWGLGRVRLVDTRDGLIFRSQLDSSLRRWPLTMTQARPRVSVFEKSGLTPGPSVAAAMPPSLLGPSLQVAEFWAWGCRAVLPLGLPPCGLPQVLSREPQFVGCKHRMSRDPEVLGAGSRRDRVAPCRELSPVCRGPVSQVLGTAGFCQQSPAPFAPLGADRGHRNTSCFSTWRLWQKPWLHLSLAAL